MLSDKVVLVTGASSGIGAGIARELGGAGAKIMLGARRLNRLEDLASEIEASGGTTLPHALEVTDRDSVRAFAEAARTAWGRIDVLVNNAGIMPLSLMSSLKLDEWDRMVDVNIKGVLYGIAAVLPEMTTRGTGHIINIASIGALSVAPTAAVYCATKHAVAAITRGMRIDLMGTPIRVTSIDPGMVETEFSIVRFHGDEERAARVYEDVQPLTAQDVADAILFAATRAAHVNVDEVLVMATAQSGATRVHRGPLLGG